MCDVLVSGDVSRVSVCRVFGNCVHRTVASCRTGTPMRTGHCYYVLVLIYIRVQLDFLHVYLRFIS